MACSLLMHEVRGSGCMLLRVVHEGDKGLAAAVHVVWPLAQASHVGAWGWVCRAEASNERAEVLNERGSTAMAH